MKTIFIFAISSLIALGILGCSSGPMGSGMSQQEKEWANKGLRSPAFYQAHESVEDKYCDAISAAWTSYAKANPPISPHECRELIHRNEDVCTRFQFCADGHENGRERSRKMTREASLITALSLHIPSSSDVLNTFKFKIFLRQKGSVGFQDLEKTVSSGAWEHEGRR